MQRLCALALLVVAALSGAGLAGKYSGSLKVTTPEGERDLSAMLVVQRTGEKLSVTAGPNADEQAPAEDVKLDGERLTFKIVPPNGGDPWTFDLKIAEKRITGAVKMFRNGEAFNGQLDVTMQ